MRCDELPPLTDPQINVTPGQPADWSFIQNGELSEETNSEWKTPEAGFKIYLEGSCSTYSIKFNTDCPQGRVTLLLATTGYSFVYFNGKLIHKWGKPYPEKKYTSLELKKPELLCGCNTLKVVVYNQNPSPLGLTYNLLQVKDGCYDCDNS